MTCPSALAARVAHVAVDAEGRLDEADYDRLLRQHQGKVRLVAVTGASNVTGFLNPLHRLAEKAHAAGGALPGGLRPARSAPPRRHA